MDKTNGIPKDTIKQLQVLSGKDDILDHPFTFQTYTDRGKKKDPLAKVYNGTIRELWPLLKKKMKQEAGVFVTVQETDGKGRKIENVVGIRAVFIENDTGKKKKTPLKPHLIIETSPGKFHIYFFTNTDRLEEFKAVQQCFVDNYGSDPNAMDKSRVLRLAGTLHQKDPDNPFTVRIVSVSNHPRYSWDEIKKAFPPVEKKKTNISNNQPVVFGLLEPARLYSALCYIDPDESYNVWLTVCMALNYESNGNSEGFEMFDRWSKSQESIKYDAEICIEKWKSCGKNNSKPVTKKTVYQLAIKRGWPGHYVSDAACLKLVPMEHYRCLLDFNKRFGFCNIHGREFILSRVYDPDLKIVKTQFNKVNAIRSEFQNHKVPVIKLFRKDGEDDPRVRKAALFDEWMDCWYRRTYNGIAFDPKQSIELDPFAQLDLPDEKSYNLYLGLTKLPVKGACDLIKNHILEVWCSGDKESNEYVLNWLARMVQQPGKRAQTAIVQRSEEGAGKNIIWDAIAEMYGSAACILTHSDHLTGRFNSHFTETVFCLANEITWGGNRKDAGILKALITDKYLRSEEKFLPSKQMKNCVHLVICSNSDWVVPVGIGDRRYFIQDVSSHSIGDYQYFKSLAHEIRNGGIQAFFFDLSQRDISKYNPAAMPNNNSFTRQTNMVESAPDYFQWLIHIASTGKINDLSTYNEAWYNTCAWFSIEEMYQSYQLHGGKATQTLFIRRLKQVINISQARRKVQGNRQRGYTFPPIKEIKSQIENHVKIKLDWENFGDDEDEYSFLY